jgi:hypothetical protein
MGAIAARPWSARSLPRARQQAGLELRGFHRRKRPGDYTTTREKRQNAVDPGRFGVNDGEDN